MKKLVFTLVLSVVLSMSVFAEGETHAGGRSCPPDQTCCPEGQTCFSGSTTDPNNTDNQPINNSTSEESETTDSNSTLADFYLFLRSIL